MSVTIQGPPAFAVSWGCRRCGHRGGIAKAKIPVNGEWSEPMLRGLVDSLRLYLVKLHSARQGCIASAEDFRVDRITDEQAHDAGLI